VKLSHFADDRDQWRALVKTVMKIRIPQNAMDFLVSWATIRLKKASSQRSRCTIPSSGRGIPDTGSHEPLNHPIPSKVMPSCRKWEPLRHFSLSDSEVGQLTALLPADGCLISIHGAARQATCDCAPVPSLSVSYREVVNLWAATSAMSECVGTVFCVTLSEPFHTGRQVSLVVPTGTGASLQDIYTIVELARSGFSNEYSAFTPVPFGTIEVTMVIIRTTYINIKTLCIVPTQCMYVFLTIITINSDIPWTGLAGWSSSWGCRVFPVRYELNRLVLGWSNKSVQLTASSSSERDAAQRQKRKCQIWSRVPDRVRHLNGRTDRQLWRNCDSG
jgi:hypothetical protein